MKKSDVYRESIKFVIRMEELLGSIPKNLAVHNQLDRASTSIQLNIAEGNRRKYTAPDRCWFSITAGKRML